MTQEHKLFKNQRVKLKGDGQDAPYAFATAGSEGWVRRLDFDRVGFPMVFIEWDKDHWAFNGEPDLWTFEDHFIPVEDTMSESSDKDLEERFIEFLKWREQQSGDGEEDLSQQMDDVYQEELKDAYKSAKDADAFLVIHVEKSESSAGPVFDPYVTTFYKDQNAGLILESQLGALAQRSHQSLAIDGIKRNLEG